jgi:hexokinase
MNSNDYYRAVLLGVVIGVGFLSLFYVFLSPVENVKPAEALEPKGTFTVVSEYKGCDVVQWHYSMLAEYKYFLDCTDDMRNK